MFAETPTVTGAMTFFEAYDPTLRYFVYVFFSGCLIGSRPRSRGTPEMLGDRPARGIHILEALDASSEARDSAT